MGSERAPREWGGEDVRPNGRGGWDISDAAAEEVLRMSSMGDEDRQGGDTGEARRALAAQWWGSCEACGRGTAWFGDSEEEVRTRIGEHMKAEHIRIWRQIPAPSGDQG